MHHTLQALSQLLGVGRPVKGFSSFSFEDWVRRFCQRRFQIVFLVVQNEPSDRTEVLEAVVRELSKGSPPTSIRNFFERFRRLNVQEDFGAIIK